MGQSEEQPLLGDAAAEAREEHCRTYGAIAAEVGASWDVTGSEIRAAAANDPYPQWIYAPLMTPEPVSSSPSISDPSVRESAVSDPASKSGQGLQEEDVRELLLEHVDVHCCWGRQPAYKWPIKKIEDCNTYVGTLETFIEEREVSDVEIPFAGKPVEALTVGRIPGPWEVDMRSEFPPLFTFSKEVRTQLPHSEVLKMCPDCKGEQEIWCPSCHVDQEPGTFVSGKTTICPECHGRGLIAHLDGADSNCATCQGMGRLPCDKCGSRGLMKCYRCLGSGAVVHSKILVVKWRTLLCRKVSATSQASSVPDDVFHEARGAQLYTNNSQECYPVQIPDSPWLTKLSSDIFAERVPVPPSARVICERHQLNVVPVSRVVMANKNNSFKFYIIGLSRQIYLREYPTRCCCGLCCCLGLFGA